MVYLASTSEINDTNFSSAANTCDEDVSLSSGTEEKIYLNGTFELSQSPKNILENIFINYWWKFNIF